MGTFKLYISCTQAMCSLQHRPHMDHAKLIKRGEGGCAAPALCVYWKWSICGLYCKLQMACVQLMCSINVPICGLYINSQIHKSGRKSFVIRNTRYIYTCIIHRYSDTPIHVLYTVGLLNTHILRIMAIHHSPPALPTHQPTETQHSPSPTRQRTHDPLDMARANHHHQTPEPIK